MNELVRCARALVGAELREDFAFAVRDGIIRETGHYRDIASKASDLPARSFPSDRLVVPGFINGHSHAYQVLLRGWADDLSFARWRDDALYRVVPHLTPDDVYWIFAFAFSEMLAAGITCVAEFFYLNGDGNAHAEAAIRAARDTGIRLVMARAWMDSEHAPRQFRETIELAASRTAELLKQHPDANVCVAPHSLHAASPQMVRAARDFADQYDCAIHIHVAEQEYEGMETQARFGATPIALLERLGVLCDRLVAIHAIYLSQEEKDLLSGRQARVIHNPTTNQYLGDGTCDVVGLRERGVTIGLGTDANVKPSLIDEMRAAALLAKLARLDGSALPARAAFELGTSRGAAALGVPTGDLVSGSAADYVVLDARSIDPWSPPVNALVYRGETSWVQATVVGGRRVYSGERSPIVRQAEAAVATIARRVNL